MLEIQQNVPEQVKALLAIAVHGVIVGDGALNDVDDLKYLLHNKKCNHYHLLYIYKCILTTRHQ